MLLQQIEQMRHHFLWLLIHHLVPPHPHHQRPVPLRFRGWQEDDEEPVKVEKPKNDKKEDEDEEPKKGGGVYDKNIKKIVVTSFF